MKKSAINIEFISGGFSLKGILHLPGVKNPPLIVGSHGLEGSKESAKQKILSKLLVRNGIAFFRFDHRGCGESQGDFIKDTSLEKRTCDFINAVKHILSLGKTSRNLAVFGSSLGGSTCINAWEKLLKMDINLCGAVLCSAPIKSRTIENIPMEANGNRPALPLSFFKHNLIFDLQAKASQLFNVMIFHGDADQVVPVSNAYDIYALAKEPKRL
ncbi:MAG: lysophospholipase, partial [Proteobacteria bacterium]|nr:lysophospholipase [Pseudomonadota bacterium]